MNKRLSAKRVIFVNRFYYPDHGATAQILSDVAEDLVASGWHVDIITSHLSYSEPDLRFERRSKHKGVNIYRLRTTGFGRSSLIGRAVDYLSFYLMCFFSVLRRAHRGDIVVVKTDPPLLSVPISLAARLKGARVVNWLQDLFPEVATELDVKLAQGFAGRFLKWMRNRSLHVADMNVAIGPRMADRLASEGIASTQIKVIENFSDDVTLQPDPKGWRQMRAEWGFSDEHFVIGYSGNLGRAHDVETILAAAEILKNEPQFKFLFVGGGHLKADIETQRKSRGLENIVFQSYQPREALAVSLSVPDIHWISLQPVLEGLILPSKLYGVTAVGRPVVMIGDPMGDVAVKAQTHNFGVSVRPGEDQELAETLKRLESRRDLLKEMGKSARAFTDLHASRAGALQRWNDVLQQVSTK